MTRRVLSIAATAAALFVTNNALADEASAAPVATETVEQPETEEPKAEEPKVEEPKAEPLEAEEPKLEAPAPVAPAPVFAPAPAPAPRFVAPLAMSTSQDRPLEAPKVGEKKSESFRIGGMVGVGFPRPFAAEGFVKIKQVVGIGFEYSFLPDTSVGGVDIQFRGIAADLRVFPFKGGFFVGMRGGKQWLATRMTVNANVTGPGGVQMGGKYQEAMSAETMFVNPRIGYLKTFDNGITVGLDAGLQIPIDPSYERQSASAHVGMKSDQADKTFSAIANTLGNKTTPTVDLLRVGFLF